MATVSNTSRNNIFLLFFGKERTNMAAPWDHTLDTSKKTRTFYVNIDRTKTKQKINPKKDAGR